MEEVVPKMAHRRVLDMEQSRKRWVRSCKRCLQALQKEFSFHFILHRRLWPWQQSRGQFTADEIGKGQFFQGNRRNLAGEGVVRNILSPKQEPVASVSNLCNGRGQWVGNRQRGVLLQFWWASFPARIWFFPIWNLKAVTASVTYS